jgi:hypothetical protein
MPTTFINDRVRIAAVMARKPAASAHAVAKPAFDRSRPPNSLAELTGADTATGAPFAHPGPADLSTVGRVPVALPREESDDYPRVVAVLNDRWRVIVCGNSIQWILQQRRGVRDNWRGRSFCCASAALVRCAREHAGELGGAALVILLRLPERIGAAP